jgi:hypothetical protein
MMKTATTQISIRTVDLDRVRRYLRGVEALAREASRSRAPKVILTALAVLARQHATVKELGVKA